VEDISIIIRILRWLAFVEPFDKHAAVGVSDLGEFGLGNGGGGGEEAWELACPIPIGGVEGGSMLPWVVGAWNWDEMVSKSRLSIRRAYKMKQITYSLLLLKSWIDVRIRLTSTLSRITTSTTNRKSWVLRCTTTTASTGLTRSPLGRHHKAEGWIKDVDPKWEQ
jgi:hypothetical protein